MPELTYQVSPNTILLNHCCIFGEMPLQTIVIGLKKCKDVFFFFFFFFVFFFPLRLVSKFMDFVFSFFSLFVFFFPLLPKWELMQPDLSCSAVVRSSFARTNLNAMKTTRQKISYRAFKCYTSESGGQKQTNGPPCLLNIYWQLLTCLT